jgi:hypothetical protein
MLALYWAGFRVLLFFVDRAALRFGARRMTFGEWDENGPKHPTSPERWEQIGLVTIGLHLDDEPPSPPPPEKSEFASENEPSA